MHSKIIATLGPSSMNYETMKSLVGYGVRIFRLNFSHSNAATFAPVVKQIRELENEVGFSLTALGDLCGPKTRIGEVKGSPLTIKKDERVILATPDKEGKGDPDLVFIGLDFPELLQGLQEGMPVSLSDGMLQFKVTRIIENDCVYEMQAQNGGILTSHKGIAFPGKTHPIKALTDKDRKDLHEGLDIGLDALAISFVQDASDIVDIKDEIKRHGTWVPVVAKLERSNAVDNLEKILDLTDVVMVARGDLGLECPVASLPIIQKRIIRAARHKQKGCIVATQMMLSMVKNPVPTRAEATDVANAILDGADCVMLSEETAIGSYPIEVVKTINGLATEAEAYFHERRTEPFHPALETDPPKYLAYGAALLANNLSSSGIVSHSGSGATLRLLSSRRPRIPVYGLTPDTRVQRYLNFFYGVQAHLPNMELDSHLDRAEYFVQNSPLFSEGENVVITSGQPTPGELRNKDTGTPNGTSTNTIKVYYK